MIGPKDPKEFFERSVAVKTAIGGLADLLRAKTKKAAERIAREIVITEDQFYLLIQNSAFLGYNYAKEVFEHMPPERPRGKEVLKDIHYLGQRKTTIYHAFFNSCVWHVFYFNYGDVTNQNDHFDGGSHVHYVSSLWQVGEMQGVIDRLKSSSYRAAGTHIKTTFGGQ